MVVPGGGDALSLLLEVQRQDTALDRLNFRLRSLEERRALEELRSRSAKLDQLIRELGVRRGDLTRRQQEIERHVEALSARIAAIEARAREGAGFREVEAMSEEAASLERQRRSLEDDELEVMERIEELEGELEPLETEQHDLADQETGAAERLSSAESALEAEIAAASSQREDLARSLPPTLSQTYEQLRRRLGGTGAAKVVDGACSGCHLRLASSERERLAQAPPGELFFCDQCGRILVP